MIRVPQIGKTIKFTKQACYVLEKDTRLLPRQLMLVEKATGRKLKAIRTDNGGEFTPNEFEVYLQAEGVRHELIIPKNA